MSQFGDVSTAKLLYQYADDSLNGYALNADLSILRHNIGSGSGNVIPIPPTEESVVHLRLPPLALPSANPCGHEVTKVSEEYI